MLHNLSSFGSPTVAFVKGNLSVQGFEGCQVWWSLDMLVCVLIVDHPPGVPVLRCVTLVIAHSWLR